MALSSHARLRAALSLCLLAAGTSCQYAPERTIPDPLPETLEWAIPQAGASAFLGVEVRENDSGSLESLSFDPGVRVHAVTERSPAACARPRAPHTRDARCPRRRCASARAALLVPSRLSPIALACRATPARPPDRSWPAVPS